MKRRWWRRRRPSLWKGMLAGMGAGLLAAWTMDQSQKLMEKASEAVKSASNSHGDNNGFGDKALQQGPPQSQVEPQQKPQQQSDSEDATMKMARKIAQPLLHRELTKDEARIAGPIVHYGFGAFVGAVYGGLAEFAPAVKVGMGSAFGSTVWATADEVGVPAMGLSEWPMQYPISSHANALAAHLVY